MWMTLKAYAEREGIRPASVYDRIKSGRVKSKKEKGRVFIEVSEDGQEQTPTKTDALNNALASRYDTENSLKQAKIRNLEAEIILKRQKAVAYRERLRVEFCEGVLECFTDSFADLKGVAVDMKMGKEQIRHFKEAYAKCLKKFEQKLVSYLRTKDEEEEKEQQDDDVR
jgi:hypothetical protein